MRRRRIFPCVLALAAVAATGSVSASAELRLSQVFGDHMVLQRDKPVRIWGWAGKGETVTVEFAGRKQTATAAADGTWLVTLDARPASAEPRELVVSASGTSVKCADVLVGEVWLLGGQSNMEMPLWLRGDGMKCAEGTRLVLDTDHPWLRIMTVPQVATRTAQETFPQGVRDGDGVMTMQWSVSASKHPAISAFSALGYYIGVQLHETLGVPIGLVDTSWGGTIASAWCSREALEAIPEAAGMLKERDAAADAWTEEGARKQLEAALADWEKRVAAAKAEKKNPPGKPALKTDPGQERNFPAASFNAMIWPLRHMALRGVFFYQGENNYFDRTDPFAKTFPAVVTSWRKALDDERLPFCLFQICGWENADRLYWQAKLPIIQESQHKAQLGLPNTGFVVTMDHPHGDIHPLVKRPIAERAVRWARAEVYGDKGATWGTPVYQSMKKEGGRLILSFRTPGSEALKITGEPTGLAIAGPDRKFVEAKAEVLDRTSLAVWSDQVTDPAAVRYAWSQRAICHLYTESGLPMGPFRTDDWPIPASEVRD
jgi:sialate O-acetylesterase